jgi:hypothetical protein
VGFFGWTVARRGLREGDAVTASAFAGAAALVGLGLSLNFWLHAGLQFNLACGLSALTLAIAAVGLRRLEPPPPLRAPPGFRRYGLVALGAFLLFYAPALLRIDIHDVHDLHAPIALSYQRDRFPTEYPYFPFEVKSYHYGGDLLGAALSRMLALDVYIAFRVLTFLGGLVLFGGVFAVARRLTDREGIPYLAAALALAAGGLSWLHLFDTGAENWWRDAWYPAIRTGGEMDLMRIPLLLDNFYQKSSSVGVPLLLPGLLWAERAATSGSRVAIVAAAALLGFLDLGHAVVFVLLTAGLLFRACLTAARARRWTPAAARTFAIVGIGLAIAAAAGGLLAQGRPGTGMALSPNLHLAAGASGAREVAWRYLSTFGLPLLLFPVTVGIAWRQRHELALTVAAVGAGAFLVPHLFEYRGGWCAARYFGLKFLPLALACMTWLLPLVYTRLLAAARTAAALLVVAVAAAPVVYALDAGIYNEGIPPPEYPESEADRGAARYLAERVRPDERVLTPSTGLARYAGLRTPILTKNVRHSGYAPRRLAEVERLLAVLYDRLPDDLLLAWRIPYVAIAPSDLSRFGPEARAKLTGPAWTLEKEIHAGGEVRRIYRWGRVTERGEELISLDGDSEHRHEGEDIGPRR